MDFYIGQKVVCLYAPHHEWYLKLCPNLPQEGIVYTIRAIGLGKNHAGILLNEIKNPEHFFWIDYVTEEPGFHFDHFRPLVERKTDISIFQKMLLTVKENA